MAALKISGGRLVCLVDEDDYDDLAQHLWFGFENYKVTYAARRPLGSGIIQMHRYLLGAEPGQKVDHIDGNGLNNRRDNLRICTDAQNQMNRRAVSTDGKSSKYKGVYFDKRRQKWCAQVQSKGKKYSGGSHQTELEAAIAYDRLATDIFGEWARPNL